MTTADGTAPASLPPPPRIDSLPAWQAALRWGFEAAIAADARTLCAVDADFLVWPLDEPALLQSLTAFLRKPGRRLVMLAARYDEVPRALPRFTAWRRDWVHALDTRQAPPEFAPTLPSLLLDDRATAVHLADATRWRGRAEQDVRARILWQERVDVVLQRSEAAFAVTTLGL